MTIISLVNMGVLIADHPYASRQTKDVLFALNALFISVFSVELALKVIFCIQIF
jgi:hypothetical protein